MGTNYEMYEHPLSQKKEIFYRFMLPLILHANGMVMERRERLFRMKALLEAGDDQTDADMNALREGAVLLRIANQEEAAAVELRTEVERLRSSGELIQIVERMRLE